MKLFVSLSTLMIIFALNNATVLAAEAVEEKLLPEQNVLLPWLVAVGVFICALIVGLKHPGRTHLD